MNIFQKDLKSFNYKNTTREETLNPVSQLETLASAKNNINETKKTIISPQTTLQHEKITNITNNNNNYRTLFLNEQKKNMDTKHQITYLKNNDHVKQLKLSHYIVQELLHIFLCSYKF